MMVESHQHHHHHHQSLSTSMKNSNNLPPASNSNNMRGSGMISDNAGGLNNSMSSTSSGSKHRKSRKSSPSSHYDGGGGGMGSHRYPPVYLQHRNRSSGPPQYNHHSYNPHMQQVPGPNGPGGPSGVGMGHPGQYPSQGSGWSKAGPEHGPSHGHGQHYGNQSTQSWSRQQQHIFRQNGNSGVKSSRSSYPHHGESMSHHPGNGGWYGGGPGGVSHGGEKSSQSSSSSMKSMDPSMKADISSPSRPRSASPHKRSSKAHQMKHPSSQQRNQNNIHNWPPHQNSPHSYNHWQGGPGPMMGNNVMPNGAKHIPPMRGNNNMLPQHLMQGGVPQHSQVPGRSSSGPGIPPAVTNNSMGPGPGSKMWGSGDDMRREVRHPGYPGGSSSDPIMNLRLCKEIGTGIDTDISRRKKDRDDDKGRGSYRCGRCGVPKKGHICPYQPKLKRRSDEPPPVMKNVATQCEIDEYMILRRLNIELQGFPESYVTAPSEMAMNVGTETTIAPQHVNQLTHNDSPHRSHLSTPRVSQPSPHHINHSPHPMNPTLSPRRGHMRNHDVPGMINPDRPLPPVSATISTSTGMGMDSGGSTSSRPDKLKF